MAYSGQLTKGGSPIGFPHHGLPDEIADSVDEMVEDNRPLAERVISSIESNYKYFTGPKANEPVRLLDYEIDFIENMLRPEIAEAALSMPRGNAKTSLMSLIAAEAVWGELAEQGSHVIIVASSIDQGKTACEFIEFYLTCKAERKGTTLKDAGIAVKIGLNYAEIKNSSEKITLRVMGKDPRYAHGKRLSFALCDEPAQWDPLKSEKMYNAVSTGDGKIDSFKVVAIGTMPDSEEHWFHKLIYSDIESVHSQIFAHVPNGDPDEDFFTEEVFIACNPLVMHNSALYKALQRAAAKARAGIGVDSYKALRLNMGTPEGIVGKPLLEPESIDNCVVDYDDLPAPTGGYILGVDLGSRSALSAATGVWATGRCESVCVHPKTGSPPLGVEKEREIVSVSSSGPIPSALELLKLVVSRWGEPVAIFADNYRSRDLMQACAFLELVKPSIQHDTVSAHEFVEHLQSACLLGLLKWTRNGIIHSAVKLAREAVSNDGAKKMARHNQAGRALTTRDDPIAALLPAAYFQHVALTGQYEKVVVTDGETIKAKA